MKTEEEIRKEYELAKIDLKETTKEFGNKIISSGEFDKDLWANIMSHKMAMNIFRWILEEKKPKKGFFDKLKLRPPKEKIPEDLEAEFM